MSEQRLATKVNVCPFIHRQYEECYCNSYNSQDTEKIISLCGGSYRLCQVYQVKFSSESVMKSVECAPKII